MSARLMAMVVEGERGRLYLPPTQEMESVAGQAKPIWRPDIEMPKKHRNFQPPGYGMTSFGDLFTSRQLVALETFSELVQKAHKRVESDAISAGVHGDERSLNAAGNGANAYGEAVEMYLGFALSKAVDRNSSLCVWESSMDRMRGTFGRQALPMTWDYVETNPFAGAGGDIYGTAHSLCEVLDQMTTSLVGYVTQADACTQTLSVADVLRLNRLPEFLHGLKAEFRCWVCGLGHQLLYPPRQIGGNEVMPEFRHQCLVL